jgi:DNA-binding NtrC family response regulator
MPITMVLAIGLDSTFLESQRQTLKASGYFVCSAQSPNAAIDEFREGDFDLVLIGQSVEAERKERLIAMIRDTGSSVSIICVAEPASYFNTMAAAAAESGQRYEMRNLGDLVARQKKPVVRATTVDLERLRRAG